MRIVTLSTRRQASRTRPPFARVGLVSLLAALACCLGASTLLSPALAAGTPSAPQPTTPSFGKAIEDYSLYEPGTTCEPKNRPGALKLAALIKSTYGQDQSIGIGRNACYTVSEHNEGRALDWMLDASNPNDMAKAHAFFHWLFAADKHGNADAMARRLGIMYIIWNGRMWRSYEGGKWGSYSGTDAHADHIHISLSLDGGTGLTSFWTGQPLPGPCEQSTVLGTPPPLPTTPMSYVPVAATRLVTTSSGRGTVNGACRLFAPPEYGSRPTRLDALVTGVAGIPATGVSAVALQVGMRSPNTDSSLRVGPTGRSLSTTPRVSAQLNGSSTSLVVVPVGADGKVSFNTSAGATGVTVDVVGYYQAEGLVTPRTVAVGSLFDPAPVWNLTNNTIQAGGKTKLTVAGRNGVPAAATAAVVNLTVAASPGKGNVFAFASGTTQPRTASLSYQSNHRYTTQAVVPLSGDGSITISNSGRRSKTVKIDVVGTYVPGSAKAGLGFVARRTLKTVASTSKNVAITTLDSRDIKVLMLGRHLPPEARAVLLNVSVRRPVADTSLTLWSAGQRRPATTSVAGIGGQSVSSTVVVPVGALQHLKLRNFGADNVNVTVSLAGYFA